MQKLHYKKLTWRSTTLKADKIHRYIYTTHNIYPPFTLVQRISSIFKDHLWCSHLPGTYSQWEPPPMTVCDRRQTAHIWHSLPGRSLQPGKIPPATHLYHAVTKKMYNSFSEDVCSFRQNNFLSKDITEMVVISKCTL